MSGMSSLSLEQLVGVMVQKAQAVAQNALQFEEGFIETYDKDTCTVTVALGPNKLLSGDMPLLQWWADTDGNGAQAGPQKGAGVLVISLDMEGRHKVCLPGMYNEKNRPPGAPAGEAWIVQKTKIAAIAPVVELKASKDDTLGAGDAIVRKSDLQAVIDHLNSNWMPQIKSPAYLMFGMPVVPAPTLLLGMLAVPTATASSVGRAKG